MTTYGGYDYGIYLSTAAAVGGGSPAGDIIRLAAKSVDPDIQFDPGITPFLDGLAFDVNMGERTVSITISECICYPHGGQSMTDMFNIISDFIYSYAQKGADPIYCFIKNLNDDQYLYLSYLNQTDTNLPFILGRFTSFRPNMSKGKITIKSIRIDEVWMSLSLS